MVSTDDILKKYGSKIERQMKNYNYESSAKTGFSHSYDEFKKAMSPEFSRYERWCKSIGGFFTVKVGEKDSARINRSIEIAHLNISPSEVMVLALMGLFLSMFVGLLVFAAIYLLTGVFSLLFLLLVFLVSIVLFFYLSKTPERLAMKWRLKASSQMVPAILYVVIYMKHTSNFEKAVSFASENLEEPLAMDFRKIFWDVEVGRFSSIKDSVDNYLEGWRDYSLEFIEAFHLIESSLYEPKEERRIDILERALQVILEGVYDKMLKYTHDVKSPLTNVYMLGIVLPTLALAILPLASTMLGGTMKAYHIFLIFNIIVPFLVIYLTINVMMKRPGGYGDASLLQKNPLYYQYASNKPYFYSAILALPFLLLGLLPLIWMYTPLPSMLGLQLDYTWQELGFDFMGSTGIFGIMQNSNGSLVGPFGILSLLLSLFVPLSIAIFFFVAENLKTKELIKEREKYKEVEAEFTSSLFQLGNRIGDGIPAEVAFSRVVESVKGTATEDFFKLVNENINSIGMSLERALFDPQRGAVIYYPSHLIATSMKILVESVKKGLRVASRSLISISDYVKNIRKVNDRLNDLLADIISDMKSNMTFLAPLLSGIIIGLSGMIAVILGSLQGLMNSFDVGSGGLEGIGNISGILSIFNITEMVPVYWLQIFVGIYIIEIVFILTGTLVTIKSGKDDLEQTCETGKNLKRTIALYFIIALLSIIVFSLVAGVALQGLAT